MTPTELDAIEARAKDAARFTMEAGDAADCLALIAEVRRLRGLVKAAEAAAPHLGERHANCPWCGYWSMGDVKRKHAPECPAFTESGDVK
jgi:hypothetical protein